jgi:hypothetical protein
MGATAAPIPYMQLAPTMSAAQESDQKTLASANRRHRFVPLPVHRIAPYHSLILFVGCPVNITYMMIADGLPKVDDRLASQMLRYSAGHEIDQISHCAGSFCKSRCPPRIVGVGATTPTCIASAWRRPSNLLVPKILPNILEIRAYLAPEENGQEDVLISRKERKYVIE